MSAIEPPKWTNCRNGAAAFLKFDAAVEPTATRVLNVATAVLRLSDPTLTSARAWALGGLPKRRPDVAAEA